MEIKSEMARSGSKEAAYFESVLWKQISIHVIHVLSKCFQLRNQWLLQSNVYCFGIAGIYPYYKQSLFTLKFQGKAKRRFHWKICSLHACMQYKIYLQTYYPYTIGILFQFPSIEEYTVGLPWRPIDIYRHAWFAYSTAYISKAYIKS